MKNKRLALWGALLVFGGLVIAVAVVMGNSSLKNELIPKIAHAATCPANATCLTGTYTVSCGVNSYDMHSGSTQQSCLADENSSAESQNYTASLSSSAYSSPGWATANNTPCTTNVQIPVNASVSQVTDVTLQAISYDDEGKAGVFTPSGGPVMDNSEYFCDNATAGHPGSNTPSNNGCNIPGSYSGGGQRTCGGTYGGDATKGSGDPPNQQGSLTQTDLNSINSGGSMTLWVYGKNALRTSVDSTNCRTGSFSSACPLSVGGGGARFAITYATCNAGFQWSGSQCVQVAAPKSSLGLSILTANVDDTNPTSQTTVINIGPAGASPMNWTSRDDGQTDYTYSPTGGNAVIPAFLPSWMHVAEANSALAAGTGDVVTFNYDHRQVPHVGASSPNAVEVNFGCVGLLTCTSTATVPYDVKYIVPAPTIGNFTLNASIQSGHAPTLSWTGADKFNTGANAATAICISGTDGFSHCTSGSASGSMTANAISSPTTYTIKVRGLSDVDSGSDNFVPKSLTVTPTATPPPTCTVSGFASQTQSTANQSLSFTLNAAGGSGSYEWSSNGGTTWSSPIAAGSFTVPLSTPGSYNVNLIDTAAGGGNTTCPTITVIAPAGAAPSMSTKITDTTKGVTISDANTVGNFTVGDAWTITVTTSNMTAGTGFGLCAVGLSCSLQTLSNVSGGNGTWTLSGTFANADIGSYEEWAQSPAASPAVISNHVKFTVAVASAAFSCSVSANPLSVTSGNTSVITWASSPSATSCTASGGLGSWSGAKGGSGSFTTPAITSNSTFSMSCLNPANSQATTCASASVTIPAASGSVTCSPSSQSTSVGQLVSFSASGGNGIFTWLLPGGVAPSPTTGANVSDDYTTMGSYTATVTSGSASASCTVTVTAPDLTITDFHLTDASGNAKSTFAPGDKIFPSVTVANNSSLDTGTSFFVSLYSNAPAAVAQKTASDVNVWADIKPTLGPNATITVSPTLNSGLWSNDGSPQAGSWTKGAGTFTARAFVNSFASVSESNSANNQAVTSYTISNAAPTVTSVKVTPDPVSVTVNGTQQFTATVAGTGSFNPAVTWTTSAGSITTSGGLFTAPATAQTVTITAKSVQDTTKSVTATVTVTAVVASDTPPIGAFDVFDCTHVAGWADDMDASSVSLNVKIKEGSTVVTSGTANGSRPDVNAALGITGNHGFDFTTPASLKDGNSHTLKLYAVDNETGAEVQIAPLAGKTATCAAPVGPPPAPANQNASCPNPPGTTATLNWNAVSGSTYQVWYYDQTLNPTGAGTCGSGITCPAQIPGTSMSISTVAGHVYQWAVFAWNGQFSPGPTWNSASCISGITIKSVTVSPNPASGQINTTQQFTATVQGTGSFSPAVTWSANAGSISANGLFTAPATGQTVTITATSVQDTTISGTATFTVNAAAPSKGITLSPSSFTFNSSGGATPPTQTMTIRNTGSVDLVWAWGVTGGNWCAIPFRGNETLAPGASTDVQVRVFPPGTPGVTGVAVGNNTNCALRVFETSDYFGNFQNASISYTVTGGAPTPTITSVTVSPNPASLQVNGTQQFTASVAGTGGFSSAVTWTASAGSISAGGLFTAPATAQTVTITAKSTQDGTKSGTATATVAVIPTNSVSLTASPASPDTVTVVNFTATAGGTAVGTLNYTFWWNCSDAGTSVAAATAACGDPTNSVNGAKFNGVAGLSQPTSHTYTTAGTYTPKVIVERGAASPAQDKTTLTVASTIPTLSFSVSPSSLTSGNSANATWSSTNITSCVASASPAEGDWSGSKAVNNGTGQLLTPLGVGVLSETYSLTCTGPGGSIAKSAVLTINAPPTVSCSSFAASPSAITPPGQSTLSWRCTNAVSCTVNGTPIGNVNNGGCVSPVSCGSELVAPATTTQYLLQCQGPAGWTSTNRSAVITVTGNGIHEINP